MIITDQNLVTKFSETENVVRCSFQSRRAFLYQAAAAIFGFSLPFKSAHSDDTVDRKVPGLFCVAYVSPQPRRDNQEAIVAKYPLAIVPQDIRPHFVKWRNKVRSINPDIWLLGYLNIHTESAVPGPGHDRLRRVKDAWSVYPWGKVPTAPSGSIPKGARIYDYRNPEWRLAFLEACYVTLKSYPYQGLFLDNCTVYNIASPIVSVREEMKASLQRVLLALRRIFPTTIFVGNSHFSWSGLNGEMNEGRPQDIATEFAPFPGHVDPRLELFLTMLKSKNDIATLKRDIALSKSYGACYGASVTGTQVLWFDEFENIRWSKPVAPRGINSHSS